MDIAGTVTEEGASIEVFQNVAIAIRLKGFEPEGGLEQAGIRVEGDKATITDSVASDCDGTAILEIQMPREMFTEKGIENLKRLVHVKGDLIKRAISTDELPINTSNETISFPWFPLKGDADEVVHHEKFIGALCSMAINQKRVTAKTVKSENEKYDFRCFLLRLGFIGDDHKAFRRYYLRNLTGNAAFYLRAVIFEHPGNLKSVSSFLPQWYFLAAGLLA